MTEQSEREIYELSFLMMTAPAERASYMDMAHFVFPLAIFEDASQAALLIPFPLVHTVVGNWDTMKTKVADECAEVSIPYHPDYDVDPRIYGWNVYIAWLDSDDLALGEMLVLEKYAKRMWDLYRQMAKPMFSGDTK